MSVLPLAVMISTPIELLLLAFHLSVFCFIARKVVNKKTTFASAFFRIYLLKSCGDYANYSMVLTSIASLAVSA